MVGGSGFGGKGCVRILGLDALLIQTIEELQLIYRLRKIACRARSSL